jgi:hypothetical protein
MPVTKEFTLFLEDWAGTLENSAGPSPNME